MIETLFGVPIYKAHIPSNSYDKTNIINDIKYNFDKNNLRDTEKFGNLHHSYNDDENPEFKKINFDSLTPHYNNIVKDFFEKNIKPTNVKQFKYSYYIVNYTATTKDQYMDAHWHMPEFDFSAVHYVNLKEGMKSTNFISPYKQLAKSVACMRSDLNKSVNKKDLMFSGYTPEYYLNTEEDDIVIFPAWLDHEIKPSIVEYKEPRITIVLNIKYEVVEYV